MGKAKKLKSKSRNAHPYGAHALDGSKKKPPAASKSKSSAKSDNRSSGQRNRHEPKLPFDPEDRILLVGEGDFSFALSLSNHHCCTSLLATTLETREALLEKYPQAGEHIEELVSSGHQVLYQVDATRLGQPHNVGGAVLRKTRFHDIIFNFPHVGGRSTDVNRQVRANQDLVVRFLETGKQLLAPGGRILVTIFEGQPYELWGVRNLARHVGLMVERSMQFEPDLYPGYKHARTLGNIEGGGGWKGETRPARTYIFRGKEDSEIAKGLERDRRGADDNISDENDEDD